MPTVQFFFEEIPPIPINAEQLSEWLTSVADSESHQILNLNYILCSDEYLHKVNVEYLNHDYYTDVITFDHSEDENTVEGDIFISLDRVRENAAEIDVHYLEELKRVMVHGLLHLLGFNDKSSEEKTLMTEKENAYLSLPKFRTNR